MLDDRGGQRKTASIDPVPKAKTYKDKSMDNAGTTFDLNTDSRINEAPTVSKPTRGRGSRGGARGAAKVTNKKESNITVNLINLNFVCIHFHVNLFRYNRKKPRHS